jgi:hypothetical protein
MIMRIGLVIVALCFVKSVYAQYPFDTLPKPNWILHNQWKTIENQPQQKIHETITVPNFYPDSVSLTLQFTMESVGDVSVNILRVYKGKKVIQSFRNDKVDYYPGYTSSFPVRVGDMTGDGKLDIKIIYDYHSNGLGLSHRPIYLLQQEDGRFIKYSFYNSFTKRLDLERDFDHDRNFEILSVNLIDYKSHSYWQFDVLKADNGKLINQNKKYGYPLYVQFLYRDNYKPVNIKPDTTGNLEIIVDTGLALD